MAIQILEADGAYIWLVQGSQALGLAGRGPGAETFKGARLPISELDPLDLTVIRERQPAYVNLGETSVGVRRDRRTSAAGSLRVMTTAWP